MLIPAGIYNNGAGRVERRIVERAIPVHQQDNDDGIDSLVASDPENQCPVVVDCGICAHRELYTYGRKYVAHRAERHMDDKTDHVCDLMRKERKKVSEGPTLVY
jgi:hypothetical protein